MRSPTGIAAIVLMVLVTVGLILWKSNSPGSLLGLSSTFDYYVLALLWVFLLWFFGCFRETTSAQHADKTLDNLDWHLDSVRAANVPKELAANVGGVFLSWLVSRDCLNTGNLVGLEETIEEYRAGKTNATELYEDFGGKLTASLVAPAAAGFSEQYLDPRTGEFFDDLEEILGTDLYQVELTPEHLQALHAVIDDRLAEWKAPLIGARS